MSNRIRLAALCGLLGTGCVRIDGGAVEISWVVRSPEGRAITDCTCAAPVISRVQLKLVGVGGDIAETTPCDGRPECAFPCQRQTGSTPFEINPGLAESDGEVPEYQISVTALGVDGATLFGVQSPAPILRSVVQGQPTEVEAFLLVTKCADYCSGTNISDPCTRP
jgi:hypothetical protein